MKSHLRSPSTIDMSRRWVISTTLSMAWPLHAPGEHRMARYRKSISPSAVRQHGAPIMHVCFVFGRDYQRFQTDSSVDLFFFATGSPSWEIIISCLPYGRKRLYFEHRLIPTLLTQKGCVGRNWHRVSVSFDCNVRGCYILHRLNRPRFCTSCNIDSIALAKQVRFKWARGRSWTQKMYCILQNGVLECSRYPRWKNNRK